jgi:hypothetical protein
MNRRNVRAEVMVRWIRLTWAGWLLGIPCIVVLALIGEVVGLGGAQFLVGAGMGAGVGLTQAFMIRKMTGEAATWVLASMFGLALPFIATDLSSVLGWSLPYILEINIAVGGFLVGLAQSLLLRSQFAGTWKWIVMSTIGWGLGGATSAVADKMLRAHAVRGLTGALAYLGIIAGGGLILGVATSISLHLITTNESNGG